MALTSIVLFLAWVGVAITGFFSVICLRNADDGLAFITHHRDELPKVMTGRYIAFTFFSLFGVLYGDLAVISAWGIALAIMALADAFIYLKAGKAIINHLAAGIFAVIVAVLAGYAHVINGAA